MPGPPARTEHKLDEPSELPGVVTAPIGTAARSFRSGRRPRSGSELEQQVAATVTSAIATSLATTLRRLVQPALLPDIVDELGRLVAGPDGDDGSGGSGDAIAVELPADLVEQATQAVADGRAESVSAYIAAALHPGDEPEPSGVARPRAGVTTRWWRAAGRRWRAGRPRRPPRRRGR